MSRTRTRNTQHWPAVTYKYVRIQHMGTAPVTIAGVAMTPGQTVVLSWNQNGPGFDTYGILGEVGTITDVPNAGVKSYNGCTHIKEEWNYPVTGGANTTLDLVKSGQKYQVTIYGDESASAAHRSRPNYNTPYPATASVQTLIAQATNRLKPGQPQVGADLLQFIAELTDFSSALTSAARTMLNYRDEVLKLLRGGYSRYEFGGGMRYPLEQDKEAFRAWMRRISSMSLKDWAKHGSDLYLTMKLVYEPLMRDLKTIRRAIQNIDRAYNRLKYPPLERVRARASASASVFLSDGQSSTGHYVRSQRTRTIDVCVWALVQSEPWFPEGLSGFPKFLWHYYGLYPRVSVVWETIPLSFVVDMVIDFGRYLRQFESTPITVKFKTYASGSSVKSTDRHDDQLLWSFNHSDLTGPAHVPGSTGTYSRTEYRRTPGPLSGWTVEGIEPVQIGLPSLGQLGTIVALLLSAFGRK